MIAGTSMVEKIQSSRVELVCTKDSGGSNGELRHVKVDMELELTGWHLWLPSLRSRIQKI
jgi:hypothetical protein